jgi:hypothetical protein
MNKKETIIELYADSEDILFADGYDDCIIGFDPVGWKVIYSRSQCIDKLCVMDEMSSEEAIDWLEYNTFNAYVGDNTPIFAEDLEWDVIIEGPEAFFDTDEFLGMNWIQRLWTRIKIAFTTFISL